jgi:hypothetical protein
MLDTKTVQMYLDGLREFSPVADKPARKSVTDPADKYDLLRFETDEVVDKTIIKKMSGSDIQALIVYATEYLATYNSEISSRFFYRKGRYLFSDKFSGCNMYATPNVPLADFAEVEACLKIKRLLKALESEAGRSK